MLQRISLADTVALSVGERLSVSGFADDTIVTEALQALAAVAGVEPCWEVEIEKAIPVAAGLGGGSSDAAAALAPRERSPAGAARPRCGSPRLAATIGADVPFFLTQRAAARHRRRHRSRSASTCRTTTRIVLVAPVERRSRPRPVTSTAPSMSGTAPRASRSGGRRCSRRSPPSGARRTSARSRRTISPRRPVSERLREAGAFRADVSGAGPCVYGLFVDRRAGRSSGRRRCVPRGRPGSSRRSRQADATGAAVSTVGA